MSDAEEIVELVEKLAYLMGRRAIHQTTTFSSWPDPVEIRETKDRLVALLSERLP